MMSGRWAHPTYVAPPSAGAAAVQVALERLPRFGRLELPEPNLHLQFLSSSLNVSDKHDIEFDGRGATLWFTPGHGVQLLGCTNVSISNLIIMYTTPTYSQSRVVSINSSSSSFVVEMDHGFPPPDPRSWGSCLYPSCETNVLFFNPHSRKLLSPQVVDWLANSTRLSNTSYLLSLAFGEAFKQPAWNRSQFGVGTVVAVKSRIGYVTYHLRNTSMIRTSSLKIGGSGNMAVWELGGGGGNSYHALTVVPGLDEQYLASNFDGFHSEDVVRAPSIVSSRFEHVGDDFFNFQNSISVVLANYGNGTVVVADDSFNSTYGRSLPSGVEVDFFEPSRSVWRAEALHKTTTSSSSRALCPNDWLDLVGNISIAFEARYGWELTSFLSSGSTLVWAVDLTASPPVKVGYTSFMQVHTTVGALVQGNVFIDGASRVGAMNAPDSIVKGNYFEATKNGGILTSAEISWLSGNLGLHNVTIEANVFNASCQNYLANYPYVQCTNNTDPIFNPSGARNIRVHDNLVV